MISQCQTVRVAKRICSYHNVIGKYMYETFNYYAFFSMLSFNIHLLTGEKVRLNALLEEKVKTDSKKTCDDPTTCPGL